jgi:predicted Zn-dependent protease
MRLFRLLLSLSIVTTIAFAGGKEVAVKLGLDASSKAVKQWEKVFEKEDKMAKMGIDKLSDSEKSDLKKYLTSHAADSDHPEAAGM